MVQMKRSIRPSRTQVPLNSGSAAIAMCPPVGGLAGTGDGFSGASAPVLRRHTRTPRSRAGHSVRPSE